MVTFRKFASDCFDTSVGGLNMASLKTHRMWKMSKIIEALCRGEHMLKFYQARYLDKI